MISFHHQSQHPQTASLASPGFLPHGSKIAALFANITTFSGRRRQPELQESQSFMFLSYQGEKSFPGALQKYFHLSPSGRTGSYGQSWLQKSLGKWPSGMPLLYAGHLSASLTAEVVRSSILQQKQEEWLLDRCQHSCPGWYMAPPYTQRLCAQGTLDRIHDDRQDYLLWDSQRFGTKTSTKTFQHSDSWLNTYWNIPEYLRYPSLIQGFIASD